MTFPKMNLHGFYRNEYHATNGTLFVIINLPHPMFSVEILYQSVLGHTNFCPHSVHLNMICFVFLCFFSVTSLSVLFVWVWNSSLRQTGRRFESHRWCMEFVTKIGVIATRVAKGLLLHTVPPN